jgi:hypothetical protein
MDPTCPSLQQCLFVGGSSPEWLTTVQNDVAVILHSEEDVAIAAATSIGGPDRSFAVITIVLD